MSEAIARLVELDEHGQALRSHELGPGRQVIGRADDVDVCIEHPDVSRYHAALDLTPEGGVIRDLGSKNGLRLDGVEIEAAPVEHGAILALGDLRLRIEHVGARVEQLLVGSGEVTLRRPAAASPAPLAGPGRRRGGRALLVPLLASVVFALLLAALMVFG